MSEKFCLKWNDFHSNVSKSFGVFRNEDYLHDVTLVSDDHKQVSAHKLVLSSCSDYFKNILKLSNKPNAHPLLCLDGISSDDLNHIMNYIYNGEVQIFQENLDRFLSIAKRLKLRGLIENEESQQHDDSPVFDEEIPKQQKEEEYVQVEVQAHSKRKFSHNLKPRDLDVVDKELVQVSEDLSEIDNKINHYIESLPDRTFKCSICGKIAKLKTNLKNHIETHLEGLSFPCQLCEKTFRSSNAYNIHKTRYHK